MADNPITIVNRALTRLGATPITAFDCASETTARIMCTIFEPALRAALQSHRWNFTEIRANLAGWLCAPEHTFGCTYVLPDNLLQLNETTLDEQTPWRVESHFCSVNGTYTNILVTDGCSPVGVVYTAYVTDPRRWSPLFTEALVTELAALAAYPVTRNATLQQGLQQEAEIKWRKARSRDGQEGRPLERWLSTRLLRARIWGNWGRDPSRLDG
jgi:hypothetical protein